MLRRLLQSRGLGEERHNNRRPAAQLNARKMTDVAAKSLNVPVSQPTNGVRWWHMLLPPVRSRAATTPPPHTHTDTAGSAAQGYWPVSGAQGNNRAVHKATISLRVHKVAPSLQPSRRRCARRAPAGLRLLQTRRWSLPGSPCYQREQSSLKVWLWRPAGATAWCQHVPVRRESLHARAAPESSNRAVHAIFNRQHVLGFLLTAMTVRMTY